MAVTSNQSRNPQHGFTSRYTGVKPGLNNNQPVFLENYKNLIVHINPIQTAVKKIITMIFSKAT